MTLNGSSITFETNITQAGNHITRTIEGCILSVISVVALTGNVSLWVVILKTRELRNESNYLILCLSSADILVSLSMPVTCFTIFRGVWIFGDSVCKFLGFVNMITFIASVMSLGVISINRYVKVCQSQRYNAIYTQRNVVLIMGGVWLLSAALAIPPLVGWGVYDYLPNQSFCFCDWSTSVSYTFFMVGACFGGPCSVMTVSYVCILRKYRNSSRKILTINASSNSCPRNESVDVNLKEDIFQASSQPVTNTSAALSVNRLSRREKRRLEDIRVTTSLLVMIFAFVLSWLPFCVTMFLSVFGKDYSWRSLDMFTLILGYANSCYNPFIYGLLNTRVKQGYNKQFSNLVNMCRGNEQSTLASDSSVPVETISD